MESHAALDDFEKTLRRVTVQHKKDMEALLSGFEAEVVRLRPLPAKPSADSQDIPLQSSITGRESTRKSEKQVSIVEEKQVNVVEGEEHTVIHTQTPHGSEAAASSRSLSQPRHSRHSGSQPRHSRDFSKWVSESMREIMNLTPWQARPDAAHAPPHCSSTLRDDDLLWNNVTAKVHDRHDHDAHHVSMVQHYVRAKGWAGKKTDHSVMRSRVAHLVESQLFDAVCACGILLNSAMLGASINASAQSANLEIPKFYEIMNYIFTCWFILELSLRWSAVGLCHFLFSKNAKWNMFDIFVVGTDVIGTFVELLAGNSDTVANLTIMRTLRVLRTARALRAVRLVSFCRELRMMVLSILMSGMSLIWSMVLLFIIIFVFGIYLMQGVTFGRARGDSDPEGKLEEFFGSLMQTIYTLFASISGGISWREVCEPLIELHWTNGVVMCFFIFFTLFAMLNIITGIFVQTAISSVQHDDNEIIQEEVGSEDSLLKKLEEVFREADLDDTGYLTIEQFKGILSDKRTRALMMGMGLDVTEASSMFSLMDLDLSGHVSLDEFLVGCMRMRGGAKSVDLVTLLYENKRLANQWKMFEAYVMAEFKAVHKLESNVDDIIHLLKRTRTQLTSQTSVASVSAPECLPREGSDGKDAMTSL